MDFSHEDGDGWEVLYQLSHASDGNVHSKVLLWILRLLSLELKTNIVEAHFARMLDWLFCYEPKPERFEASDLLLNLGGHGIINTPFIGTLGYSVLHVTVSCGFWKDNVSAVVARGSDLHRRGLETLYTPFEESPTSLAMYSERVFSYWLRALADVDVDIENFIDQELERNPEVHAGWEKETLLELFAHGDRPDLHRLDMWTCSDCLERITWVRVQPYWRHLLERIKGRLYPYDPVSAVSEVDEDEDVDLDSCSTDLTPELDATRNVSPPKPDEIPSKEESETEADISNDITTTQSESICLYDKHELVCMDCWLHYKRTGTRKQPQSEDEDWSKRKDVPSNDDSSECEYSPFLIHS